jgi:hypothetical protein
LLRLSAWERPVPCASIYAEHLTCNALTPSICRTIQDMLNKASQKGYTGDAAWQYILESSTRSRPSVNASLGVAPVKPGG